jgi:hypothetical protein
MGFNCWSSKYNHSHILLYVLDYTLMVQLKTLFVTVVVLFGYYYLCRHRLPKWCRRIFTLR